MSKAKYTVKVKTGDQFNASPGIFGGVYITLTGTEGRTGPHKLSHWWRPDFKRGEEDHFIVEADDVGNVLLVQLDVKKGLFRNEAEWYAEKVSVHSHSRDEQDRYNWGWVTKQVVLYHSKALLPNVQQHHLTQDQRKLEIISRKERYFWAKKDTHQRPGFIDAATHEDLPKNAQFTDDADRNFTDGAVIGRTNLALGIATTDIVEGFGDSFDDLDDYKKMFVTVKNIPWVADNGKWQDDRVFGYQFLNGCNPCTLERCEKLPENFPVTEDLVRKSLSRGRSLQQEMQDGHIYIVDYKELVGLKRLPGRYLPECLGLFYVTPQKHLVPIAIQLYQTPGDSNPIWTPSDSKYEWMLAKMFLKAADNNVHQIRIHLLMTHLVMEAIAMATFRLMPSIHPVAKLLFPHIRGTMPINVRAREKLINPGGVVDKAQGLGGGGHIQLLERSYKNFTWDMLNVPLMLEKRGVDDAEKLPKYYYRDDALKLWGVTEQFVKEFVDVTYASDEDVKRDHELAAWVQEIHDEGFPQREDDVNHKFPESLATRDELVKLLTCIVFDGSCQHAAVNFGQLDIYGFIPNAPSIMRQPPPSSKGVVDLKYVLDTLPTREQAGFQIAAAYALTQFADNERYLGNYEDSHFHEAKYQEIIGKYDEKLRRIREEIDERNESLDIPYVYLRPDRVPMSVAI